MTASIKQFKEHFSTPIYGLTRSCSDCQLQKAIEWGSCTVSKYRGVLRAEKLMNRSKTKGAAPASGAAAQVSVPGCLYSLPQHPEHSLSLAGACWHLEAFSVSKTWAVGIVLAVKQSLTLFIAAHHADSCSRSIKCHEAADDSREHYC